MTEKIQSAKVICRGGLDSSENFLELSELSPGAAMSLVNYEPSLFGGYRRINGYTKFNSTVNPDQAEGKILGIAIYKSEFITARKDKSANTYSLYKSGFNSPWVKQTTPNPRLVGGVDKLRYATFNFNGTDKIIIVDGANIPLVYDGTSWTEISGDQLAEITKPKYVTIFKNHVFLSGDSNFPNIVVHSAPNDESDWTAAAGAGQIAAGFAVTQIKPFRDSNYVWGFNNIKKISVNQTTFVLEDVAQNIGCIASDSVVELGGDLYFLSQDGVRPISGTDRIGDIEIASVSRQIHQTIKTFIDNHSMQAVNAVTVRNKSQYRLFFSEDSDTDYTSDGIIGGLRGTQEGVTWEWGQLRGIRTTCATSGYINQTEFVLHGDIDGNIYRQEVGNTFDTTPIECTYQTPYLDFGDSQVRKTLRYLNIFIRPEGPLTLNTSVSFDWGDRWVITPSGYTEATQGNSAIYSIAIYGEAVYGGTTTPIMINNLEGSCFSVQMTFTSNDAGPPHSIQGLVFEFSPDGRI